MDSPIILDSYWNLPVEKIIAELGSDAARGLSMREANVRLKHFGRNALETKKRETALGLFLNLLISVQNFVGRFSQRQVGVIKADDVMRSIFNTGKLPHNSLKY